MWPSIARAAIDRYSRPAQVVLDPMCGIGTVLIEAVRLGRSAVGVDCEREWVELARRQVADATASRTGSWGKVFSGDAADLATLLKEKRLRRPVDLIVTSPPYGSVTHGRPKTYRETAGGVQSRDKRYFTGGAAHPAQLATSSVRKLTAGLERVWAECAAVLKPDGVLVVTARPFTEAGVTIDFPSLIVQTAANAGFALSERHAALLGRWTGGLLRVHATFFHKNRVRALHQAGEPSFLRVHEDVLVFGRAS